MKKQAKPAREDLKKEIRAMIADIAEVDEDEITDDASFTEDLGFDSMMALEILAKLEKNYKIRIPEEELPKLNSLAQTVDLVERHLR